jgi:hypothetical protein
MTTILINLGQSHMTTSNLRQYPASTPNHLRATAVPSEYSEPAPISFFPENTFYKTKTWHWVRQQPVQPSISEDSAIRIVLHSVEVVHFTHTIRQIRQDTTTDRHSLPSIHLNMGAYPVEYTSLANPGHLPLPNVVPVPRREKPKCLPAG